MRTTSAWTSVLMLALTLAGVESAAAQSPTAQPTAPPPNPALAGKSLEELLALEVDTVFGASRRRQHVSEAPSSVTIVTAEDVRTFGWRTLAEALAAVRGFYTTNDRNYTYVGVRGFGRPSDYNNRVLVLVNGHRFNDNIYDQALVDSEFPIDLALIERIEIIRGPGSALYGTNAFFAVINVVLRSGGAVGGSESAIDAGSYATYRLRSTFGTRTASGIDALLSISRTSSDGRDVLYFPEYDEASSGFGLSRHADADRAHNIVGSLSRGAFALQGAYGTREKQIPTGAYGTTLGDERTRTRDSRAWLDASFTDTLRGAVVTTRAFVDYSGYSGVYMFDEGTVENRDTALGVWVGAESTVSKRVSMRHQLTGGLEYRRNLRQDQRSWDVEPYWSYVDERIRSQQVGLYVQDEIQLHRRLTATVGGRYDWWGLTGGTGRPRLGLVYRTDANTAVKALFGAAYRAPTVFEAFYERDPEGRPLRPETVSTSEVVYEQHIGGTLRFTASAYFTDAENLIDQAAEGDILYFRNGGEAHARGVEVEAERRWTSGVLLRASYVAQQTRDPQRNVEISNSPRSLGLVHLAVPAWSRRLLLGAESQFIGARLTNAGAETPGVWLTNLSLTFLPTRHPLSLSARVSNLFDRAYAHPVGLEFRQDVIPQNGRTVAVRATLRF
jgi:outer membrane receptor protein involved in Fe transport